MVRVPTNRIPTHPGEMLREEFLMPMGITQRELADGKSNPPGGSGPDTQSKYSDRHRRAEFREFLPHRVALCGAQPDCQTDRTQR